MSYLVPEAEAAGGLTIQIDGNSDSKYSDQEFLTVHGHWDNPGVGQCQVWVSLSVYQSGGSWEPCTYEVPLYVMSWNINDDNGTELRDQAYHAAIPVDDNGDFSITLNVSDIAEDGFGHYMVRVEPSINEIYDWKEIWFEPGTNTSTGDTTPPTLSLSAYPTIITTTNSVGYQPVVQSAYIGIGDMGSYTTYHDLIGEIWFTVTATDDTGSPLNWALPPVCTPGPGQHLDDPELFIFPIGATTVTCTSTDSAGNVSETLSFTVNVVLEEADTTPPTLTVPANQILYAEDASPIVDPVLSLTYADGGIINESGSPSNNFEKYSWFSSLGAVDIITNSTGTHSQVITPNCVAPVPSGPYAGHNYAIIRYDPGTYYYNWSGSEASWGVVLKHFSTGGGSSSFGSTIAFPMGTTTLTCSATDYAGNTVSSSFTVTVLEEAADTTPPTVTFNGPSGSDGSLDTEIRTALNSTGYSFYWEVMVNDDEFSMSSSTVADDEAVVLSCSTGNVTIPAIWGELDGKNWNQPSRLWHFKHTFGVNPTPGHTVTCTATDTAGNTSSESFVFKVLEPLGGSDPIPTVTASAYINGTSPTGRTFYMFGTDVVPALEHFNNSVSWTANTAYFTASISSDATNSVVWPTSQYAAEIKFRKSIESHSSWDPGIENGWQTPIPTDWVAGTYTVAWEASPNNDDWAGSVSVTVPALPGDTAVEEEIVIPSWIKNNAGWWDAGLIDDRNYVTGLQWLITNGVMIIG